MAALAAPSAALAHSFSSAKWLVQPGQRALRLRGTVGRGAQSAIALPLLLRGDGRRRASPLPLEPAGGPDLCSELLELRPDVPQLGLGLCQRALALRGRRLSHRLDLGTQPLLRPLGGGARDDGVALLCRGTLT